MSENYHASSIVTIGNDVWLWSIITARDSLTDTSSHEELQQLCGKAINSRIVRRWVGRPPAATVTHCGSPSFRVSVSVGDVDDSVGRLLADIGRQGNAADVGPRGQQISTLVTPVPRVATVNGGHAA